MLGDAVRRGLHQRETFRLRVLWGMRWWWGCFLPCLLRLTDRTDGGAFLYLFSRFLFAAGLSCAADVWSCGDMLPSSPSTSGLGIVSEPV